MGSGYGFALLINGIPGAGKTQTSLGLVNRLGAYGIPARHIVFDRDRHLFAPSGDGYVFSNDAVRENTYKKAAAHYRERVEQGENLIIDTGARDDKSRKPLLEEVPGIQLVYLACGHLRAVARETIRSITREDLELQRGLFLYLRAYATRSAHQLGLISGDKVVSYPGVTAETTEPKNPNLIINTGGISIDNVVDRIMEFMQQKELIPELSKQLITSSDRVRVDLILTERMPT